MQWNAPKVRRRTPSDAKYAGALSDYSPVGMDSVPVVPIRFNQMAQHRGHGTVCHWCTPPKMTHGDERSSERPATIVFQVGTSYLKRPG